MSFDKESFKKDQALKQKLADESNKLTKAGQDIQKRIAAKEQAFGREKFNYQKKHDKRQRGMAIGNLALQGAMSGFGGQGGMPDKISDLLSRFGKTKAVRVDPSGVAKLPGNATPGLFSKIRGGITSGNTLGSGLVGLGVGSMFGDSGAMKKGLLGAGAGMAMNLLKPGKFNLSGLLTSGFSGGLGALGSGLF